MYNSPLLIALQVAFLIGCFLYYTFNKNNFPETDYDIVIVGSGLAGLSAAYEVNRRSEKHMKILVIEKEKRLGGNSKKASSGINILDSPVQHKNKVKDSFNLFYSDTIKSGKGKSDENLVSTLVSNSTSIYDYFKQLNIDISQLGILGGHSVPRTHRPLKGTAGYIITSVFEKAVLGIKNVKILGNTTAIDLIYPNKDTLNEKELKEGAVTMVNGIVVKNNLDGSIKKISCKAVILASGGYAHDFSTDIKEKNDYSLLEEFAPNLMKFPTTNGPQARGLGLKMARKIAADLVNMKEIQVHPTGFVNPKNRFDKTKILAAELIRGVGAILINQEGKRFCNELGTRDYVTKQILKYGNKINNQEIDQTEAFLILNQEGVNKYGDNIKFYFKIGLFTKYSSFEEFAKNKEINKENLEKTIKEYNQNTNGKKDQFGKILFPTKFNFNDVVYVSVITPSLHYTMGGIKINSNAEVINVKGNVIHGLYGAGEVTGGVHGGNRLGGNSLLECAVYGIRAARSASKYANEEYKKLI